MAVEAAVKATGERYLRILDRTAASMSASDRARLVDAWDFECSQSAARHEADATPAAEA